MNGFGLNGASIDGAGNTNSFVAIPASSASLSLAMSERALSFFPSTVMGMSIDSAGSIISISPFAPSTANLSIASSGVLYNVTPFPAQTLSASLAMSGNPILTGGLSGADGMGISVSGMPRRITYFDATVLESSIDVRGDLLRSIRYMAGLMDLSIGLSGELLSFKPMTGSMSFSLDMDGDLSVNATEHDLDENTMVRMYQERTMVRQ
jgi:hypothetical protein